MKHAVLTIIGFAMLIARHAGAETTIIQLDPASPGRVFEGRGKVETIIGRDAFPTRPAHEMGMM
jgi:hypothetical protein